MIFELIVYVIGKEGTEQVILLGRTVFCQKLREATGAVISGMLGVFIVLLAFARSHIFVK